MDCKQWTKWLLVGMTVVVCAIPADRADAQDRRRGRRERRGDAGGEQVRDTQRQIEESAKGMGPWDQHQRIIEDATDKFFQQNNWTSEPDQYARSLLRQIEKIPPWQQHDRQKVFLDGLQSRYGLSEDQKSLLDKEVHQVGMQVSMKHFATLAPIAMDMIRTRAKGDPFTPEQVAGWMRQLGPVMDDAKKAMDEVSAKLGATMSESQKEIFDKDVKALLKRHNDVVKMVDKWKSGGWTPMDWGLQNDGPHAAMVAEMQRRDAEKNNLTEQKEFSKPLGDGNAKATDEDTWEKYVRHFCTYYDCDERQKSQAFGILKDVQKQAVGYRSAHRLDIEKAEAAAKDAVSAERKTYYAKELERQLAPIGELFTQLKTRLDATVLTTEQRTKMPAAKADASERR